MADGYTVRAGELASGSGKVTRQSQQCAEVAEAVVRAITQMAGAAGHPALADALVGASEAGTEMFLVTTELYAYVADGLTQAAANYGNAEQAIIGRLRGPR